MRTRSAVLPAVREEGETLGGHGFYQLDGHGSASLILAAALAAGNLGRQLDTLAVQRGGTRRRARVLLYGRADCRFGGSVRRFCSSLR